MNSVAQDIRYSLRMLLKQRVITAAAVVSLSLGIGANTAIFSLMNVLILRSLPVNDPGRLARLTTKTPESSTGNSRISIPMYQQLRKSQQVFSDLFAWDGGGVQNVEANGVKFAGSISVVTGGYFSTLGIQPLIGRLISPQDLSLDAGQPAAVAVISYGCWKGHYNGDPSVIGQTIRLESHPFTIVGVTPEIFSGLIIEVATDITVPVGYSGNIGYRDRTSSGYEVFARLKPGVTMDRAQAQIESLWPAIQLASLPERYVGAKREAFLARRVKLESAATGNSFLRERYRRPLLVLMAMVALLLLIACVNLANLTLARAAGRRHEFITRVALGADKWRIVRQMLTESLMLSFAGAALGLIIAYWASSFLLHTMWRGVAPLAVDAAPDLRVLTFTTVISLLTSVLFGIPPAWNIFRTDPTGTLQKSSRIVRGGSGVFGKTLIGAQVALSLVLVIGAGLFVRSLLKIRSVDVGYRRGHILVIQSFPNSEAESSLIPNRAPYYQELAKLLAQIPGVESVSYSHMGPALSYELKEPVSVASPQALPAQAMFEAIGPGFFHLVGMRLLAGREFDWRDKEGAQPVAIISESLAHHLFGSTSPIGRVIDFSSRGKLEVVGVVNSASLWMVQSREPLAVYVSLMQLPTYNAPLVEIRTVGDALAALSPARKVFESLGRHIVLKAETLDQRAEAFLTIDRTIANLAAFFAGLALLLASVGLFGLLSYAVTMRTSEIGLRMALGAQRTSVQVMVLRGVVGLVLTGIAVGIAAALAASRLVASMIYGVDAGDPLTIVLSALTLLASAAIAAYIPARRASRIDPMESLRSE